MISTGPKIFSIETHWGSSLIIVGAGAEKTGAPSVRSPKFFIMFLNCFADVFFVICFNFYLNKFGITVHFQSDVEIDGDSHAVFSPRKLSQKLSPSWSKTVRPKIWKLTQNGGPETVPESLPENLSENLPETCPKILGSKIEWRPALKVFGRFWGGFLGASKNHHF